MNKTSSILAGLMITALGIVLIIAHDSIGSIGIAIAAGIVFFLAGIVSLLLTTTSTPGNLYDSKGRRIKVGSSRGISRSFNIVTGIAAIILGLCMLIFRDTFATLVPFIFGCIVALGAIIQIYILAVGVRPLALSPWLYLVPLVLGGGAIYVFTLTTDNDAMIMLITGIALALFGVASFAESLMVGYLAHKRATEANNTVADTSEVDSEISDKITTLD